MNDASVLGSRYDILKTKEIVLYFHEKICMITTTEYSRVDIYLYKKKTRCAIYRAVQTNG